MSELQGILEILKEKAPGSDGVSYLQNNNPNVEFINRKVKFLINKCFIFFNV